MTNFTVYELFHFIPKNDNEKELFNFDKLIIDEFIKELDEDFFYLGGQLKMKHNDLINLDSIKQVREINKKRTIEYGGPCNSFEARSIYNYNKKLETIEQMINSYLMIMEIREKEKKRIKLV